MDGFDREEGFWSDYHGGGFVVELWRGGWMERMID